MLFGHTHILRLYGTAFLVLSLYVCICMYVRTIMFYWLSNSVNYQFGPCKVERFSFHRFLTSLYFVYLHSCVLTLYANFRSVSNPLSNIKHLILCVTSVCACGLLHFVCGVAPDHIRHHRCGNQEDSETFKFMFFGWTISFIEYSGETFRKVVPNWAPFYVFVDIFI